MKDLPTLVAIMTVATTAMTAVSVFCAWVMWGLRAQFTTKAEHAVLVKQLGETLSELSALKTSINNMPTVRSVHELAIAVERLSGDVRATNERLKSGDQRFELIEKTTTLIHEHLLEQSKN